MDLLLVHHFAQCEVHNLCRGDDVPDGAVVLLETAGDAYNEDKLRILAFREIVDIATAAATRPMVRGHTTSTATPPRSPLASGEEASS